MQAKLKKKLLYAFKQQGFSINEGSIQLDNQESENLKKVHETSKLERINSN